MPSSPCRWLTLAALAASVTLCAQMQEPILLSNPQVEGHQEGDRPVAHYSAAEVDQGLRTGNYQYWRNVHVWLTVGPDGRVESVEPVYHDYADVKALLAAEKTRSFAPWYVDGRAARVRFVDEIGVTGPEPLSNPLSQPDIDMSQVIINWGGYEANVTILGDGTVILRADPEALPGGEHVTHVPQETVRGLLEQFRRAAFFALDSIYDGGGTDASPRFLILKIGPQMKQVMDMDPELREMPKTVRDIEDQIDAIANTDKLVKSLPWIRAYSSTIAAEDTEPATKEIPTEALQPWVPAPRTWQGK